MNDQNLKPCPFCGSKAKIEILPVTFSETPGLGIEVSCSKCNIHKATRVVIPCSFEDIQQEYYKAIEIWNQRIEK